jgi:hypothetical protein
MITEIFGKLVYITLNSDKLFLGKNFKEIIFKKLQDWNTQGFLFNKKMKNMWEWRISPCVNIEKKEYEKRFYWKTKEIFEMQEKFLF